MVKKAKPINFLVPCERSAQISFVVPTAWEVWDIWISSNTPKEITADWLVSNDDAWEWHDCVDSGNDGGMECVSIERIEDR